MSNNYTKAREPRAFSQFEWLIAWRYLRAKRREGGISTIAWYALIGVMLGVATLIVVQAVMVGFKEEFTERIIGANAHLSIISSSYDPKSGKGKLIKNIEDIEKKIKNIDGISHIIPLVKSEIMASSNNRNAGVQVFGLNKEDLKALELLSRPESFNGDIENFNPGIAIGGGVARSLGIEVNEILTLISPQGVETILGTSPRISNYRVSYIFNVGRYDIDKVRVYIPIGDAQRLFNRDNQYDQVDIILLDPLEVEKYKAILSEVLSDDYLFWSWKDASGAFLDALDIERRVMFIILSLVVLIAALNIVSGLVMLVKNKGRDIGILRTIGVSEASIMRIFFICGFLIGAFGTLLGVGLGCLFSLYIQEIQSLVELVTGRGLWNSELRFLTEVPSSLRLKDIATITSMALILSVVITIIPARNAAKMDPVEALRYE